MQCSAMPAALSIDWPTVRSAVEAGASYAKCAEVFGIKETAIRKRASLDKWLVPSRLRGIVSRASVRRVSQEVSQTLGERAVAESWQERAESHRALMFGKATEALRAAVPPALRTWRDLEIADRVARKAAGLEGSGAPEVSVFFQAGWFQSEARVFDPGD